MKAIVNFVAFQIGWFAAVLGAGRGMPWLGVLVVPLVVALNLFLAEDWKSELKTALAATGMGFVFDTVMTVVGAFTPVPYVLPVPFSPLWMMLLWMNQATTLNGCMSWLRGRYPLGAVFGAIGGPLGYLGGAKLGAAELPSHRGLVILALGWAIAFPALLAIPQLLAAAQPRRDKTTVPDRM